MVIAATLLVLAPATALAHTGPPPTPAHAWHVWSFEWPVLISLALIAWVYGRGLHALWRRAGTGHGVSVWQAASFGAGWLVLCVALVSPLDGIAAALFSAHMIQHILLIEAAAPLLVLGQPGTLLLWALPLPARAVVGRWWKRRTTLRACWWWLTRLPVAWTFSAVLLWAWHLPTLYDAAVRVQAVHALEHACFLSGACLLWYAILERVARRHGQYISALAALVATALQSVALGVVLALAPRAWYAPYAGSTAAWGLTPLEDQQLAGLIMWIPAGAVYLAAIAILFVRWIGSAGQPPHRAPVPSANGGYRQPLDSERNVPPSAAAGADPPYRPTSQGL